MKNIKYSRFAVKMSAFESVGKIKATPVIAENRFISRVIR